MDSIKCPHCGKKVELSEAIVHELQEEIRSSEQEKLKIQFEKEKQEELLVRSKEIEKKLAQKNKDNIILLEKEKEEREKLRIKLIKKDQESDKIEEKIRFEASKEVRLEKLELEKKLSDTQKALEVAKEKSKQGSQQLQGEVLELELEEKLTDTFKDDQFVPIPKGVEGADIWQKVIYRGKVVGSILWETKRTKAWSRSWIVKLKDDAAKINASESIIISKTLPEEITNFDRKEGVWISNFENALSLARYVRFLITTVSTLKNGSQKSDKEWEQIRDYMLSDAFKHRMQAHFDGIRAMRDSMEAERRSTILRWKKQESQIDKLDTNTTNFYGELKAIVADLPKIEGVDEYLLEDEKETLF